MGPRKRYCKKERCRSRLSETQGKGKGGWGKTKRKTEVNKKRIENCNNNYDSNEKERVGDRFFFKGSFRQLEVRSTEILSACKGTGVSLFHRTSTGRCREKY